MNKKYKATVNSNHKLPADDNILNRDFKASKLCWKMVSDITIFLTDEGICNECVK
jgi:putative transposase